MAEEAACQKTAAAHETVDTDGQDQMGKADVAVVPQAENVAQTSDEVHVNVQKVPHLIQNGLRLQLRDDSLPFAAYTYGKILGSVVTELDWTIIVPEYVTACGDHIHCHQLKMDESLNEVLAGYLYSEAVAVVLINSENSYNIFEEVHGEACLPVLVLSSEDGQKLLQSLEDAEDISVFAAIKTNSSDYAHLEPSTTAESMKPPSPLPLPPLPQSLGNITVVGSSCSKIYCARLCS